MKNQSVSTNLDWICVIIFIALVILGWLNIYSSSLSLSMVNDSIFDISQVYGKQMLFIFLTIPIIFIVLFAEVAFPAGNANLTKALIFFAIKIIWQRCWI